MKIVVAADSCGISLKHTVISLLKEAQIEIIDLGVLNKEDKTPYYVLAQRVAQKIQQKEAEQGILCCWSGMGMAIVANKHHDIYAAVCETPFAAKQARIINNANVLALGEAISTPVQTKEILQAWLSAKFAEGCSEQEQQWLKESLAAIKRIENS